MNKQNDSKIEASTLEEFLEQDAKLNQENLEIAKKFKDKKTIKF